MRQPLPFLVGDMRVEVTPKDMRLVRRCKARLTQELNYNYLQPNIIISSVNQFLREI
jgi:hypothetical protein